MHIFYEYIWKSVYYMPVVPSMLHLKYCLAAAGLNKSTALTVLWSHCTNKTIFSWTSAAVSRRKLLLRYTDTLA